MELRGESIRGQLDGTIPATKKEQRNQKSLVDASYLDLSVMGGMDTGGGPEAFKPFQNENEWGDGSVPTDRKEAAAQPDMQQKRETSMENMPDIRPVNHTRISIMGNVISYGICFVILAAALVFAKKYRRKPHG